MEHCTGARTGKFTTAKKLVPYFPTNAPHLCIVIFIVNIISIVMIIVISSTIIIIIVVVRVNKPVLSTFTANGSVEALRVNI